MANFGEYYAPDELKRWGLIALAVGGVGTIGLFLAGLLNPGVMEQSLRSWLLGFIFWGGITFGCLSYGRSVGSCEPQSA